MRAGGISFRNRPFSKRSYVLSGHKTRTWSRSENRRRTGIPGYPRLHRHGLAASHGDLLYFQVSPANIAVLSKSMMERRIRQLMLVLSALPGMEILCLDSHACFDRNQAYMKEQMEQEENPAVRLLLQKDREHLDSIQSELAADRQFLFVLRVKNRTEEQVFQTVNRAEKAMADQGFEVRRLDKEGIKQQLQAYFDAGRADAARCGTVPSGWREDEDIPTQKAAYRGGAGGYGGEGFL